MGRVSGDKIVRPAPKTPPQGYAPQVKPGHKPSPKAPVRSAPPSPPQVGPKPGHKPSPRAPLTAAEKRHHLPHPSARKLSSPDPAQARFVLQDTALRGELAQQYDFRGKDYSHLETDRPRLFRLTADVAQHAGLTMNYLIATMYVETNLTISINGNAKGLGQFKSIAWKKVTTSDEFKEIWDKVAPGIAIPSRPGSSPTADVVAAAAWTQIREKDLGIATWMEGELKDMARRLAYHLTDSTAEKKIRELDITGKVTFSDTDNQTNWRRFSVVLAKENAPSYFAKAK